jgi:hypothetical protein
MQLIVGELEDAKIGTTSPQSKGKGKIFFLFSL